MLYFNHCISDIPTGNNWTISACDGPLDNVEGLQYMYLILDQ